MNTKITISKGPSDRKHNPFMPKKMGFLAPKRNSASVPLAHLN